MTDSCYYYYCRPYCLNVDRNLSDGFRDSFFLDCYNNAWYCKERDKNITFVAVCICLCFDSVFTKRKQNRLIEKEFLVCATFEGCIIMFLFSRFAYFGSHFSTRTTTFVRKTK